MPETVVNCLHIFSNAVDSIIILIIITIIILVFYRKLFTTIENNGWRICFFFGSFIANVLAAISFERRSKAMQRKKPVLLIIITHERKNK